MPGIAASTSDTCELGSPPNAVDAPEKSFDCEVTCAWTSRPMTTSKSPVAPRTSFFGSVGRTMTFIGLSRRSCLLVYVGATAYIGTGKQAQPWAARMTVHAPVSQDDEGGVSRLGRPA